MTNYVAMIRGVGPENPNMKGERLKWAFEQLGFDNVRPFLTSGNVLFSCNITDTAKLESKIEKALPGLLDFSREVFVKSQSELQSLVAADPFAGLEHQNAGKTYLTVTFFKTPPELPNLPHQPEGKPFKLLANIDGALCSVVDLTTGKTPELMAYLERHYGKSLTTRTWNTIARLLNKM